MNATQSFLILPIEHQRQIVRKQKGNWQLPIQATTVTGNKVGRIMALEPIARNGWLMIPEDAQRRWPVLWQQFEEMGSESWPSHDDGPDSLASCISLLTQGSTPSDTVQDAVEEYGELDWET